MAILIDYNPLIISSVSVAQNNLDPGMEIDIKFIRHLFLNQLISFRKKFEKYGDAIICCDSGNVWRKDFFPYYKASRKKGRDESALRWDVIFDAIKTLTKELEEEFPYKVVRVDRCEADDIIGVLCQYFSENEFVQTGLIEEPQPIMIVSNDKDFKQLQKFRNVKQFSPMFSKQISERNPELYLKEHLIRGDSGDGIPNFLSDDDTFVTEKRQKGIQSKKLEGWLKAKSPEEFCDDEMLRNYHRNQKMIDLSMVPQEYQDQIIANYKNANVGDRAKLFDYFIRHKLKNLLPSINAI